MEEELERAFAKEGFKFENEEARKECSTLCTSFGLCPSDLVESWEVFYMNAQLDGSTILSSNVGKFRMHLQSQQREAFVREHGDMHLYSANDVEMLDAMEVEKKQQEVLQTPSKPLVPPEAARRLPVTTPKQVSSPTTPFSQRTSKCIVQYVFNEHLQEGLLPDEADNNIEEQDFVVRRLKDVRRCQLEVLSSGVAAGSRYMRDQLESRVNELERRMKRFAKAFTDNDSRSVSQPVAYAFQEIVPVVGRICYDAEDGERNNVFLEGSIEYSGGQRIRLDLRQLTHCSFFPGQIVIVEGQNPSGHCLIVSRVLGSIPLPPYLPPSDEEPAAKRLATTEDVPKLTSNKTQDSLTILVASGPFTTSDNFSFEPLMDLLAHARKKRPNVLILMGPFIDAEHPLVKTGAVDRVLSHVFQEEIRTRIEDYCQDLGEGARVILVPSTRDAFHDRVFPQPPFDATVFEDPSRQITMLPNPSLILLDEVAIGMCTTDILRHLSAEEYFYNTAGVSSDRMTRLGTHLIGQRSFYPLFPPAVGTNLDVSLKPGALDLSCTPDILLLPSDLVPCVKPLSYSPSIGEEKTSLLVNPGRIAKGVMGGTFVEMFVAAGGGDIGGRAKLTVMRI